MIAFFGHTTVYWALVAAALLALAALCAAPFIERSWICRFSSDRLFLGVAGLAFVEMRWPTVFDRAPYIDEAQIAAQAITAARHAVPWRSFDGTTSGPLNTYALVIPRLLGIEDPLVGARLVAIVLTLVVLCATFLAVRSLYGTRLARLSIVPIAVLFGLGCNTDFSTYATELLSVALLSVALAASLRVACREARHPRNALFVAGLCCGATPFAKLQATPLAALTALLCLIAVASAMRWDSKLAGLAGRFALGLATPTTVILVVVTIAGALRDFWISYVAQALYSMQGDPATLATAFGFPEYHAYFTREADLGIVLLTAWVIALALTLPTFRQGLLPRLAPIGALLCLLVSAYVVRAPHRAYPHYFLFAVVPVTLVVATLAGALSVAVGKARRVGVEMFVALCTVLIVIPMIGFAWSARAPFLAEVRGERLVPNDPIAQNIVAFDPPGGRVAIWGYAPYLYVESSTMMGTRDSISQFALLDGPYRAYFRERFLRDMEENRPALFVDACAPGQFNFWDRATFGYETFPELARYVRDHYAMVSETNGVRIFHRLGAV